jgi:hypothetical protein
MRTCVTTLVVAGLLFTATPVRAQADARAIVDRAVKAHGGQDVLNKVKAEKVKAKGTLFFEGVSVPYTVETAIVLPGQFRNEMKVTVLGEETTEVMVLNGDKAWVTHNGQPQPVDEKVRAEMEETKYADQVTMLTPLFDTKRFQLAALGEMKVHDRPVLGVKVSAKGHRDIELYFDKETGLLAKVKRMALNPNMVAALQEEYWSDYKDTAGVKRPMKFQVYQDGKLSGEGELTEVKYPDQIDRSLFEKP